MPGSPDSPGPPGASVGATGYADTGLPPELTAQFLARARQEAARLAALAGEPDGTALAAIEAGAHRLSGSAGTYGFAALGTAAARLERRAARLQRGGAATQRQRRALVEAARCLLALAADPLANSTGPP